MTGAILGIIGVALALLAPAWVEWMRRPQLRVELGSDANREDPSWRIVHVRVINKPLGNPFGRVFLRNAATACQVRIEFSSRSDGTGFSVRGKWSARPEPLAIVPLHGGTFTQVFDPEKIPQTLTLDVAPSPAGESVAVAIKHNGDAVAYGFDPALYAGGNLRGDGFALPHEAYDVTVVAHAGEIQSDSVRFRLDNAGTTYRDLRLERVTQPS